MEGRKHGACMWLGKLFTHGRCPLRDNQILFCTLFSKCHPFYARDNGRSKLLVKNLIRCFFLFSAVRSCDSRRSDSNGVGDYQFLCNEHSSS